MPQFDSSGDTSGPPRLDEQLDAFVRQSLGVTEFSAEWCGWDHGEARVWRLDFATCDNVRARVFLKAWRQSGKFARERRALQEWGEPLSATYRVPRILAGLPGAALLLTAVPGERVDMQERAPALEQSIHEQAGRFLSALHAVPWEDTDISLSEAYEKRAATWAVRAQAHLEQPVIQRVQDRIRAALPLLDKVRRVPCHRDFSPRNWLVDSEGVVGFIDFEHARPDVRMGDFERLWSRVWPDRPDLEEAFRAGYGQILTAEDLELLQHLAALAALSTVVWAREHADPEFAAHGLSVLKRLRLL